MTPMPRIDLNCDLGEGAGHDQELMPFLTSANIACGAHAGDESTMRATVELALRHGVAIGAHPGFADREHFGRRELSLTSEEIRLLVLRQIRDLQSVVRGVGAQLFHVKPHGALYNLAARDGVVARSVADAVYEADPRLVLYGLADSKLITAGMAGGLVTANEIFADRTYQGDGTLTPRNQPDALIADEGTVIAQVLQLIQEGRVRTTDGTMVNIRADTVCIHGDGSGAVAIAQKLAAELRQAGVAIRRPGDAIASDATVKSRRGC